MTACSLKQVQDMFPAPEGSRRVMCANIVRKDSDRHHCTSLSLFECCGKLLSKLALPAFLSKPKRDKRSPSRKMASPGRQVQYGTASYDAIESERAQMDAICLWRGKGSWRKRCERSCVNRSSTSGVYADVRMAGTMVSYPLEMLHLSQVPVKRVHGYITAIRLACLPTTPQRHA